MCIAPNRLHDGTDVACRECWQCRKARVDDWVGRGIAEMRTCHAAHAVTLTYGRDQREDSVTYGEAEHERAVVLTYSDVQKFLKLLRRHGFPCRYLVTGEYGAAKGRSHWHILLFWQERVPPGIELRKNVRFTRYNDRGKAVGEFWPHGHVFFDTGSYEAFRYNLKYVLKAQGEAASEAQGKAVCSKHPPLGAAYFASMAADYARQGLVPSDGVYTFPEALRKNGERVQFRLPNASASSRLFAEAFVAEWERLHGEPPELNEWLQTQLTGRSETYRDNERLADLEYREKTAPAKPLSEAVQRQKDIAEHGLELADVFDGKRWVKQWRKADGSASSANL